MEELVDKIKFLSMDMQDNMLKSVRGNKAAGQRARRASLKLQGLLKEYRKVSLEMAKK